MTLEPKPGRVVCLIQVGKSWVIGENDPERTSPKLRRQYSNGDATYGTHAEDRALQLARRIGGKIKRVLVLRWDKSGVLTMARPCQYCAARFVQEGVRPRKIAWSNWAGEIENGN